MKQKWILLTLVIFSLLACTSADHEAMRQRLQYVSDCNRADTVFTERWLPTVDSLVAYFDRHGAANERMMAHYVQGRVHYDMGEAPQALECYQKAAEQADTTRSDCDLYTLYAVYGQMADLFHAQYLPDDEMQALKMAERIAWKDKDTLAALISFDLRLRPYYHRNDTDSVLYIEQQARELYLKYGYKDKAAQTFLTNISILLDRHQYDEVKTCIKTFELKSGWFDEDGSIKKGKELYYYDKGRYLLATGRQDSALYYFRKTLQAGFAEAGYRGILSVYEQYGSSDSIAKYAKLFAAANDSCYYHVNQEKVHQVSATYDYSRQQQVAEMKERESERWKVGTTYLTLLFLIVILLIAYAFNRIKIRKLEEIRFLTNTKAELEQLLSKEEMLTREKEEEVLRLNSKNSRMQRTMKEESRRLQLQVKALREQLLNKDDDTISLESIPIIEKFQKKFQTYSAHYLKPNEKEWERLEGAFRVQYPVYYQLITSHHSMTKEQIRICLMICMGFAEYEMASTLDVDGKKIDRKKRQINKKLFRDESASTLKDNLMVYMPSLHRKV